MNEFDLFTEEQLEEIIAKCQADILAGGVVTSWASDGTSVTRQLSGSPSMILKKAYIALQSKRGNVTRSAGLYCNN